MKITLYGPRIRCMFGAALVTIKYLRAAGVVAVMAGCLLGSPAASAAAGSHVRPARIFAPVFEAYTGGDLGVIARQAGVRFVTLAFAQAASRSGAGACQLAWDTGNSMSWDQYQPAVRALRRAGGGAILSFGGWTADQGGTEIAESCHSVQAITAAYEGIVTSYHIDRFSMDIEGPAAFGDRASIARRDKAIALLQRWAKARRIPLWIQLTLQVRTTGLSERALNLIRDATRNHATINSINLMVFNYYETTPLKMAAAAIKSADSVHRQLRALYPRLTSAQIWRKLAFTMMPGIDDYPGKTEVTHLPDARAMMNFARARQMNYLSIWALERDNGGCPGIADAATCSGIQQQPWAFTHLLKGFTG